MTRSITTPHNLYPQMHVISNGKYSTVVDNSGNGFSLFDRELALTRWKEGHYGQYIFVRDLDDNKLWSVAYQPTCVEPESYEVIFSENKIEFKRKDFGILLHTEISISSTENVEYRKVSITNLSDQARRLEFTSYGEVVLTSSRGDLMHPAFAKMFVESEFSSNSLIFARRPRSKHEEKLFLGHNVNNVSEYESSRMHFLGRGRGIQNPTVFDSKQKLSGIIGEVLDPIFSLRTCVEVEVGKTESVIFRTAFAKSYQELENLLSRQIEHKDYANSDFSDRQLECYQQILSALFYNIDKLRGDPQILANNKLAQSGLWSFGVSGDLPIVLLKNVLSLEHVTELVKAHQYHYSRGICFDLVFITNRDSEYEKAIRASTSASFCGKRAGIHFVQVSPLEAELLETVARVVLCGDSGSVYSQLKFKQEQGVKKASKANVLNYQKLDLPKSEYQFFNGIGGFVDRGRAYQLELSNGILPPLPWSNIIANPSFGFLVTESGGGYTWSENSRENKLTPWSNDPVTDLSGEIIYIRENNALWSPTPKPVNSRSEYLVKHTFGSSQFLSKSNDIESTLRISGSVEHRVKWWNLNLKNNSSKKRQLEIYLYIDWVLGVSRDESFRYLVSGFDPQEDFLHVVNNYNNEFAGRIVFIGSSHKIKSYTSSKLEFIGRHHTIEYPAFFESEKELGKKLGSGFDACGVIKIDVELEANQEQQVQFYLSEAESLEQARRESSSYRSLEFSQSELAKVNQQLDLELNAIQVKTPDPAFDILMNGWLLYQTQYCRVYARSAFYQSGGAIGFRDQLQDVMALLYTRSDIARAQIILHASRQFPEGDAQHWWHPPTGRGVRTQISDDYLWLPYVVNQYLEVTQDYTVLDEQAAFIQGDKLAAGQHDSYYIPQVLSETSSIYQHCILALDRALVFGSHGLPLMGGGDWNDGMNEVGIEGKGESVWLAWFLSDCLEKFSKIAALRKDDQRSEKYKAKAQELINSIEQNAWDGHWYRRAYFDDGTPLGSHTNLECRIDSLAQTWAVIVGRGNPERRRVAMDSLRKELINKKAKIISLLTPPFHSSALEPGYIKGYLSGIRENGGQYTHAASWVVLATVLEGRGTEAAELFSMINPINHTSSLEQVLKYQGEPYVLAGDVYSTPLHLGRVGWSWYTGSAGWVYRVGLEYILGLVVRGTYFTLNPVIPAAWSEFAIDFKHCDVLYEILVKNPNGVEHGVDSIEIDGKKSADRRINFINTNSEKVKILVTMS